MATSAKTHVLIADITGSTALYDSMPDAQALALISDILSHMRATVAKHGGICVKSKGDDTLSTFEDANAVFAAAREMIEHDWPHALAVHVGAYWGDILNLDEDIYGDAVNTAARLSALAKPGEVLLGGRVFEQLEARTQALCVTMGGLKLKGKSAPVKVHSFAVGGMDTQTVLFGAKQQAPERRTASVTLSCNGAAWEITDNGSILIGRSAACDAVLDRPWVSRKHGSFDLRAAQLEYTDHSSSGSTVITSDGRRFTLQRRSMPLTGDGVVLVGTLDEGEEASQIRYATNDLVPE